MTSGAVYLCDIAPTFNVSAFPFRAGEVSQLFNSLVSSTCAEITTLFVQERPSNGTNHEEALPPQNR